MHAAAGSCAPDSTSERAKSYSITAELRGNCFGHASAGTNHDRDAVLLFRVTCGCRCCIVHVFEAVEERTMQWARCMLHALR